MESIRVSNRIYSAWSYTDIMKIAGYGVFGTPAVIIDGEVKSVGKIPKKEDIKAWIK